MDSELHALLARVKRIVNSSRIAIEHARKTVEETLDKARASRGGTVPEDRDSSGPEVQTTDQPTAQVPIRFSERHNAV